jgi:RND family efflux transporter MFP subunit
MKPWTKRFVITLVVVVLGVGLIRVLSTRATQKASLEAQQAAAGAQVVLELSPSDLVQVKTQNLVLGLAISGQIKAVNSAFVKARVGGELQALTVREGDTVKAGDTIARIEVTEYQARTRQALQLAESAKAQVDIAKRSFDNNRSLVDQGFISKTALDASQASLSAAEANYHAAQAGGDVANKSLDDTVLRAPISGQVAQRLAQPGERVSVDARIVEIVDLRKLELEASLSAAESMSVRVGQTAQIHVEGTDKFLNATVARMNPSAIAGSRAVMVYLSVPALASLRQGLFAQGILKTGSLQTLAVPLDTVRTDKPQPYVQWVHDATVTHQTVTMGARSELNGQMVVAIEGLPEGAIVLSGRVGSVRSGTSVKILQGSK